MLWALGLLALAQTVLSLFVVRRWLGFVRRYAAGTHSASPAESGAGEHSALRTPDYAPPLTLIVPCRGSEPGLQENLSAYRRQDYPDYELLLMVSGPDDPASAVARAVPGARLLYAAPRQDEGEKVTRLRAAARETRAASRVLVFADSDGRPEPGWLRELVHPLARPEPEVGAATSYRWYFPVRGGLPSLLRAVWNSFSASLLGDHARNFCWGGSTALRRGTFERLRVDQHWRGSVSDDLRLTAALRGAGLPIRYVPTCLVPTHGDCGWRELFSWTTRQVIMMRVYRSGVWKLGLTANTLYCSGVVALVALLPALPAAALLAAITLAGMGTGVARVSGACAALPSHRSEIARLRWAYMLLTPLVPFLMLYNCVVAGLTRTIAWRGTSYRLEGPQQTVVIRRAPAAPAATSKAAAAGSTAGKEA